MSSNDGHQAVGEAFGAILQLVFSLTFPLLIITVCGVSYILAFEFHMPEFALWAGLAMGLIDIATTNTWVAIALVIFGLSALPLAWVAFREQELRVSKTILLWVVAGMLLGGVFWLRTAWPFDGSGWQMIVYAIILLAAWSTVIEAVLATLGIVAHVRASRPPPIQPPRYEPHGPQQRRGRPSDPETI
jgi:hypothetical protein